MLVQIYDIFRSLLLVVGVVDINVVGHRLAMLLGPLVVSLVGRRPRLPFPALVRVDGPKGLAAAAGGGPRPRRRGRPLVEDLDVAVARVVVRLAGRRAAARADHGCWRAAVCGLAAAGVGGFAAWLARLRTAISLYWQGLFKTLRGV